MCVAVLCPGKQRRKALRKVLQARLAAAGAFDKPPQTLRAKRMLERIEESTRAARVAKLRQPAVSSPDDSPRSEVAMDDLELDDED